MTTAVNAPLEGIAAEQFTTAKEGFGAAPIPRDLVMQIYVLSLAVSMKRIADAMWGDEETSGLLQLLNPLDVRNNY